MDVLTPVIAVIFSILIFSICGWCIKRRRKGTVYGFNRVPVTLAVQYVSALPIVQPPYPIQATHPTPMQAPAPRFTGYQTQPYPPTTAAGFCGPPGVCGYPPAQQGAHYPPAGPSYPPPNQHQTQAAPPPSYTESVGHEAGCLQSELLASYYHIRAETLSSIYKYNSDEQPIENVIMKAAAF